MKYTVYIVEVGETAFYLTDDTVGRPVAGAGPSIRHFLKADLAETCIARDLPDDMDARVVPVEIEA